MPFEAADARYAWLNDGFGPWESTFDELQGRAWYQGEIPGPLAFLGMNRTRQTSLRS